MKINFLNSLLEKAIPGRKDITKLSKKNIINKKGQRQTVYVRVTPEEKEEGKGEGFLSILMGFFGYSTKSQAMTAPSTEFKRNNVKTALPDVSMTEWTSHFNEYFKNKEKWDKKFSGGGKKKTGGTRPGGKTRTSTGGGGGKGKTGKPALNIQVMKLLYQLYGNKKKATGASTGKPETLQPVNVDIETLDLDLDESEEIDLGDEENNFETMPEDDKTSGAKEDKSKITSEKKEGKIKKPEFKSDNYESSVSHSALENRTDKENMEQLKRRMAANEEALEYAKKNKNEKDEMFFQDAINHTKYYIQKLQSKTLKDQKSASADKIKEQTNPKQIKEAKIKAQEIAEESFDSGKTVQPHDNEKLMDAIKELTSKQVAMAEKQNKSERTLKKLDLMGSLYRVAQLAKQNKKMEMDEIVSLVRTGADLPTPTNKAFSGVENSLLKAKIIEQDVIDFIKKNPSPKDEDFHSFVERFTKDHAIGEQAAYKLLGDFFAAGKTKGNKYRVDPAELKMGIKVESEHTSNKIIAEKIARDHLAEIPDYYTRLAGMEQGVKKAFTGRVQCGLIKGVVLYRDGHLLLKAFGHKDVSKLQKKQIVNKQGKKQTVYVKVGDKQPANKKKAKGQADPRIKQADDTVKQARREQVKSALKRFIMTLGDVYSGQGGAEEPGQGLQEQGQAMEKKAKTKEMATKTKQAIAAQNKEQMKNKTRKKSKTKTTEQASETTGKVNIPKK